MFTIINMFAQYLVHEGTNRLHFDVHLCKYISFCLRDKY